MQEAVTAERRYQAQVTVLEQTRDNDEAMLVRKSLWDLMAVVETANKKVAQAVSEAKAAESLAQDLEHT